MKLPILLPPLLCLAYASDAAAICRIVEEAGSPPPVMVPAQSVLLIKYNDALISACPEPGDAGPDAGLDAGLGDGGLDGGTPDSGIPLMLDAGSFDSGSLDGGFPDAGENDAGAPDGGEDLACEEIRGEAVTMIVQPQFHISSEGARFALLMVTPSWPIVSTADTNILHDLATATAPEVIVQERYVEDVSLGYQCKDPKWNGGGCAGGSYSEGGGGSTWVPPESDYEPDDPDVPMVETIGAYEIARLRVSDSDELATWLDNFDYVYSEQDLLAAQPYIEEGWTLVAVRIRHDFSHSGGLTPLAFSWAGSELRLPTGISRAPSPSETDLTVYISADQRYDFPQGHVSYAQRSGLRGLDFLTRTDMWVDLSLGADADPVASQSYGTTRDTVNVERVVRIPSSDCPDDDEEEGCGCSVDRGPGLGSLLILVALVLGLRRRRRS